MDRPVLVVDGMGGDLGAAMARRFAEAHEARGRAVERVEARARPGWRSLLARIRAGEVAGIILSGSKAGVYEPEAWIRDLLGFARDLVLEAPPVPVLGVCFGHQLLAEALAGPGAVEPRPPARRGVVEVEVTGEAPIFEGLPRPRFRAVVTHSRSARRRRSRPARGGRGPDTPIQAMQHRERPVFSVQFHPEHSRALMDLDEREYGHRNWASVPDAAIAAAEAPRVLERFAEVVARHARR